MNLQLLKLVIFGWDSNNVFQQTNPVKHISVSDEVMVLPLWQNTRHTELNNTKKPRLHEDFSQPKSDKSDGENNDD